MIHIFHRWTKWIDIGEVSIYNLDYDSRTPTDIYFRQERRCQICNKLQTRRVRT